MTTVRTLRENPRKWAKAAGIVCTALLVGMLTTSDCLSADPSRHWLHAGALPPGAIGGQRLLRGGPLVGCQQQVEIKVPNGIEISADVGGGYGAANEGSLTTAVQVGPLYRFRAVGVPGMTNVEVYPTIELVDRIYPPAGKESDFPIRVELTLDDLRMAAQGAFITRVVYLENPKTALPIEQKLSEEENKQLWFEAKATDDPLVLADQMGRPIAIVRLGSRSYGSENRDPRFASSVHLAGFQSSDCETYNEQESPQPYPGTFDAGCYNETDCECGPNCSVAGPRDEYLCDGNDAQLQAAVEHDGTLIGIEQEDTVAHYESPDGRLLVVPSNKVCIYAPRYASVRQVVNPVAAKQRLFVDAVGDQIILAEADRDQLPSSSLQNLSLQERAIDVVTSLYRSREQPIEGLRREKVLLTKSSVGPQLNLQMVMAEEFSAEEKAVIAEHSLAAITWTGDQQVQVVLEGRGASAVFHVDEPGIIYELFGPSKPKLRLVKLASTDSAQPGDEIEFTLRYDNVGEVAIKNVTLVDNLTTRLKFVEGSANSSRDAEFAFVNNDAGSLVLRWQLVEELPPGEGGFITFKTVVR